MPRRDHFARDHGIGGMLVGGRGRAAVSLRVVYSVVPGRHLYIHVPFCARRCSYCDFSIAVRSVTPVDDYLRGLHMELALLIEHSSRLEPLETIYLGGGTPSRLGGHGVASAVEAVRELWR